MVDANEKEIAKPRVGHETSKHHEEDPTEELGSIEKKEPNWHKGSAIIQSVVAAIMLISIIFTQCNQKSFEKFQYAILRPIVYIDLRESSGNISDGYFNYEYSVSNSGKTPAFRFAIRSDIDSLLEFPEIAPEDTLATIFPNQDGMVVPDRVELLIDGELAVNCTIDQIAELLPIYLHIIYSYTDQFDNVFEFRSTYIIRLNEGRLTYTPIFSREDVIYD